MSALTVLVLAALAIGARGTPVPQDMTTNSVVTQSMTKEDGENLVASLILAVARDWDLGYEDATEFVRVIPATEINGTTLGPSSHSVGEPQPSSLTAPSAR